MGTTIELDRWLLEGDPWVRYQVLLDQDLRHQAELAENRSALLAHPPFKMLIEKVKDVWSPLVSMWLGQYLGWIGLAIFAAFVAVLFFLYKKNEEAWDVFAGAAKTTKSK